MYVYWLPPSSVSQDLIEFGVWKYVKLCKVQESKTWPYQKLCLIHEPISLVNSNILSPCVSVNLKTAPTCTKLSKGEIEIFGMPRPVRLAQD